MVWKSLSKTAFPGGLFLAVICGCASFMQEDKVISPPLCGVATVKNQSGQADTAFPRAVVRPSGDFCWCTEARDTLVFFFVMFQQDTVHLSILRSDGSLLRTLFNRLLFRGNYSIYWPVDVSDKIVGFSLSTSQDSNLFWVRLRN